MSENRKLYTVGADEEGVARVESVEDLGPVDIDVVQAKLLVHSWTDSEGTSLPSIRGRSPVLVEGVVPGQVQFQLVKIPANYGGGLHRTDTVDFDTVVSGHPVFDYGNGTIQLKPGDCVFVKAVDHSWITADEDASFTAVLYGVAPDEGEHRTERHLRIVDGELFES